MTMRRRTFVAGALLATGGAGAAWLGLRAERRARGGAGAEAEPLPDGRFLVRGAGLAFGTGVSVAVVHADPEQAHLAASEALDEVQRVDRLCTVYRPDSQVGRLNAEGSLSRPDPGLVRLLRFSQRLAALSDGAFDPTVQPLWLLADRCRREGRRPSREELGAAHGLVDWRALEVSPRRIALGRPGMGLTLNGVAQGWATDLALAALRERGIADALLDTGEMGAEGARQPGRPWTVGVQNPRRPGEVVARLPLDGRVLATSGDYAAPFTDDFESHHVFDPRTGRSPPGVSSVAVAAPVGMEADALTKPMMILDRARALRLLAHFPGAGALWIDKRGELAGSVALPHEPA